MTESHFTSAILADLRAKRPDAEIDKLNLRVGRGIPDVVITSPRHGVTWIEVKVARSTRDTGWSRCTSLQQRKLKRLAYTTGRAWIVWRTALGGWVVDAVTGHGSGDTVPLFRADDRRTARQALVAWLAEHI